MVANGNEIVNENVNVIGSERENENVNVIGSERENENVIRLDAQQLTPVGTHALFFSEFLKKDCPYIWKNLTRPTEPEWQELSSIYGDVMIMDVCKKIENRADLRTKYKNLYQTLKNWLQRETRQTGKDFNESPSVRASEYAQVITEFRNSSNNSLT